MKTLLESIIEGFISEQPMKAVKKDTNRVVTYTNKNNYQKALSTGTHRPFDPVKDKDLEDEPTGGEEPKAEPTTQDIEKIADLPDDERGVTPAGTNARSLEDSVAEGMVAPGNDFSRYQEALSVLAAQYLLDNPDASDEDVMRHIVSIDCGSQTLTGGVTASLPKEMLGGFKEMNSSGVFDECDKEYSDSQNKARYLTMMMAKRKVQKTQRAEQSAGLSGEITRDSYSGDASSLQAMKARVGAHEGPIYGDDGIEIPKEKVLEWLDGFGTSKYPADTAIISTDESGKLILQSFSDKKELNAIINNSTVLKELDEEIKFLEDHCKKTGQDCTKQLKQLTKIRQEYEKAEERLKQITDYPADTIIDACNSGDRKNIQKKMKQTKERSKSKGRNSEKYWRPTVGKYQQNDVSRSKPSASAQQKIKFLTQADPNWKPGQKVSEEHAFCAFAHEAKYLMRDDSESSLSAPQQKVLMGAIENEERFAEAVEQVREQSLKQLQLARKTLDSIESPVSGVGMGLYLDALRARHALHFDMNEFGGSLSMVAGNGVYDHKDFEKCLMGMTNEEEFVTGFGISEKRIKGKAGSIQAGRTTGSSIEVFSLTKDKKKINIGSRSIRSKDGLLGRLQTTFNYHPDFQKCLKGKSPQQEESISPREQQLRNELKKLVRDVAINRLGKYGN